MSSEKDLLKYYTAELKRAEGDKPATEQVIQNIANEASRLGRESQGLWSLHTVLLRTKDI